jgi:carbamoyl-phosphate synthase large subunit
MAEDRKLFREAMDRIGLENPKATIVAAPKLPSGKYDIAAGIRGDCRASNTWVCPPSSAPPLRLAAPGAA